nr:immunoglobulin light chain junction region [Macaca mulatta]
DYYCSSYAGINNFGLF